MKPAGNAPRCFRASKAFVAVTADSQIAQKSTRPLWILENRSLASIPQKRLAGLEALDRHADRDDPAQPTAWDPAPSHARVREDRVTSGEGECTPAASLADARSATYGTGVSQHHAERSLVAILRLLLRSRTEGGDAR